MVKAMLIYGSTIGNTEILSKSVEEGLKSSDVEVTVKNVETASTEELKDYDAIILGCSTWGEGELQDDFISFEEEMSEIKLDGKKAAVFGPGDSETYPDTFCDAVDILEKRLKNCGAEIVIDSLKIDGDVEPKCEEAKNWGKKIGEILKNG